LLAVASPAVRAGVDGSCTYKGQKLAFVDGHARRAPDMFDENELLPTLWFVTVAFDPAPLAAASAKDNDDAVTRQVFDHDSAELTLRLDAAGKVVEALQLYVPPGSNRSLSSNEVGELKLSGGIAARAAGRFKLDDDELHCDLNFDLPMGGAGPGAKPAAKPKPAGQPLPAGGGEPGKVYMAMHRATLAGDVEAMLALAEKAKADEMRKSQGQPEFPQMLAMVRAFEPAEVRVTGGRIDGDHAELDIVGKDSDGAAMTGTVKLSKEAGSWKIGNVSTNSKISN
jgi:hypothetical protein